MYAAWIRGTTIEGKVWHNADSQWEDSTGGTTYPDGIDIGATGLNNNISMSSDTSNNLHLSYINSSGNVVYRKYTQGRGFTTPVLASSFDGADTNLCNGGDGWDSGSCGSGNTAVGNESTTVYSPTYGAKFTTNGTAANAYVDKALGSSYNALYARISFRLQSTSIGTWGNTDILYFQDSTYWDSTYVLIQKYDDGTYHIVFGDNSATGYYDTGQTISLGTWYSLELYATRNASTGTAQIWLNGTSIYTVSSKNTGRADWNYIVTGIVASSSNNNLLYVDNAVVDTNRIYSYPWGSATTVDSNAGNTYTTISVNSTNNDIYVMSLRSSNVSYVKYTGGAWGSPTDPGWSEGTAPAYLTSNYADPGRIFMEWTSGSGPYTLNWNYIIIPEKVWMLVVLSIFIPRLLRRKKKMVIRDIKGKKEKLKWET